MRRLWLSSSRRVAVRGVTGFFIHKSRVEDDDTNKIIKQPHPEVDPQSSFMGVGSGGDYGNVLAEFDGAEEEFQVLEWFGQTTAAAPKDNNAHFSTRIFLFPSVAQILRCQMIPRPVVSASIRS